MMMLMVYEEVRWYMMMYGYAYGCVMTYDGDI